MLETLFFFLRRVKTYALIGESGTGKSFRAKLVAQKYGIDFIIDDGLLIRDNRILAGHSAKKEKTFMAAVKVALFDDKEQRNSVIKRLRNEQFKKILLLGTSEKMITKIAARLELPPPDRIIHIEDISTQEEIEKAIRTRKIEGKHVIPVPSIEVKRNYPQIFYDAIRIFRRRRLQDTLVNKAQVHEKSLVRPEYSKRGKVIISEAALSQMVIHCVDEYNDQILIKKISVKDADAGYRLVITLDVPSKLQLGGELHTLQQYIIDNIEHFTGILIEEVHLIIGRIRKEEKSG
jgi:adenylate kinase family enzyme